ncbi:zinc carboxypeptidase-like [Vanessa atalanta]|uniref:zinc carboxypeptidase-like n=1 Tax=Vanessa atalanta TaxID=42275 RepID=UPI001FCDA969|nr:zinc carboxypeptidase-like [Vanessa atalanta]
MITKLFILCTLLYINVSCSMKLGYNKYNHYKYYDIKGDESALDHLKNSMLDKDDSLLYIGNIKSAQIIVPPELDSAFLEIAKNDKVNATLLFDDISEVIRSEKPSILRSKKKGFSWDAYYDVDDIYNYLSNVSRTYPQWTEVIVGGKTYEGRQIRGIRINTPAAEGVEKPVFFIESGIHAREWIAPATTTYFINQLLTSSNPNVTRLRDQFDWRIFPTVNPDGYHYSYVVDRYWRKTRSISSNGCIGADPNRNWDYNWGQHSSSDNPCDYQVYAGSRPFSEIETKTLSSYISGIDNLLFYVGFHSHAALLLLPYSDSTEHVHNYEDLVQIGKVSLEYGYQVNKVMYSGPGTAAETLYKASGGSMDWVRYALNTPLVYTYELRGSSFHWPPEKIPEQGEEVTQMILGLAIEAENLGYFYSDFS